MYCVLFLPEEKKKGTKPCVSCQRDLRKTSCQNLVRVCVRLQENLPLAIMTSYATSTVMMTTKDIAHNPIQTCLHGSLHIHINGLWALWSPGGGKKKNYSHLPMCENKKKLRTNWKEITSILYSIYTNKLCRQVNTDCTAGPSQLMLWSVTPKS